MIAKTFLAVRPVVSLFSGQARWLFLFLPVAFRAVGGNDWTATQKGVAT